MSFEPKLVLESQTGLSSLLSFSDRYLALGGDKIEIWDGKEIISSFTITDGGQVSALRYLDDILYVMTLNESSISLYAFEPITLRLINKRTVFVLPFYPDLMVLAGGHLFVTFRGPLERIKLLALNLFDFEIKTIIDYPFISKMIGEEEMLIGFSKGSLELWDARKIKKRADLPFESWVEPDFLLNLEILIGHRENLIFMINLRNGCFILSPRFESNLNSISNGRQFFLLETWESLYLTDFKFHFKVKVEGASFPRQACLSRKGDAIYLLSGDREVVRIKVS